LENAKAINHAHLLQYLASPASANLRYLYLNGNAINRVETLIESAPQWVIPFTFMQQLDSWEMGGV
jgi:hypothetical protein